MNKNVIHKIKGMNRDFSESSYSPEFAYENKNIRITATDKNTLLSITNEKGTKYTDILNIGKIKGVPVGQAVIDNELVLFSTGKTIYINNIQIDEYKPNDIQFEYTEIDDILKDTDDSIYKLWFNEEHNLEGEVLYSGNLNFDYKYPLETLSFFENDNIKKVYWTDNLNQPRMINIATEKDKRLSWVDTTFDFTPTLKLEEEITVTKNILGGVFASGTIQYAFTYFNLFGQESNIFYVSPLYYIAYKDRGANPEELVNNSFTIELCNLDRNFDYVRIYSIHRTSQDATPKVKNVADIKINKQGRDVLLGSKVVGYTNIDNITYTDGGGNEHPITSFVVKEETSEYTYWEFRGTIRSVNITAVGKANSPTSLKLYKNGYVELKGSSIIAENRIDAKFVDTGIVGTNVDPTELLYVGGEEVLFGTMTQKDNTLFAGDLTIQRKSIEDDIKTSLKRDVEVQAYSFFSEEDTLSLDKPYSYYNTLNDGNSLNIKTFKNREWYRLGIQLQHYTGKWSEPIWITDYRVNIKFDTNINDTNSYKIPSINIKGNYVGQEIVLKRLQQAGYKKVRPIVVYPSLYERETICQGILCPTVFNLQDRVNNAPYVQSSWFSRPMAPEKPKNFGDDDYLNYEYSDYRIMVNEPLGGTKYSDYENRYIVKFGAWAEFRHYKGLPTPNFRNAELQSTNYPSVQKFPEGISGTKTTFDFPTVREYEDKNEVLEIRGHNYFIDQSIVTMHSPDIEFNSGIEELNLRDLSLRVIGYVPLHSNLSDIDIQTNTSPKSFIGMSGIPKGFYKGDIETFYQISIDAGIFAGWKSLISGTFWNDRFSHLTEDVKKSNREFGFAIYPWHRSQSLNNQKTLEEGDTVISSELKSKKLSNLKYSMFTKYFEEIDFWEPDQGLSDAKLFNSNDVIMTSLKNPIEGEADIIYYGNVDTINKSKNGYPIMITEFARDISFYGLPYKSLMDVREKYNVREDFDNTGAPISIKYKSTPHIVIAFKSAKDLSLPNTNFQITLPNHVNYMDEFNGNVEYTQSVLPWTDSMKVNIAQGKLLNIDRPQYGYLLLGELYNPNVSNRFGGDTREALENNNWLPCGESISLYDFFYNTKDLIWEEGDSFYQRYDHIKTYPFTLEDPNSITEIVSFMCETRVNLDGRYDKNRGLKSNLVMSPKNFNQLNTAYNQYNNFFNFRMLKEQDYDLDNFKNSITWTKTKMAGELVDTWTNINLSNTLDLDGNKGKVNALRKINNTIISFQDSCISQILYNEQTQIATTNGVPIEMASSGKVQGKRVISDNIGCCNKWSICETNSGLYFIDDISKTIYNYNGQFTPLSDVLGFTSFMNTSLKYLDLWNPVDFNNYVSYYDKLNNEILFINNDYCLSYSEPLQQFTSFYSYNRTPYFSLLENRMILWNIDITGKDYCSWLYQEGDYNMFFDKYESYWTTILSNPDNLQDKTFNTLEFIADTWDKEGNLLNTTFDKLTSWNEYQSGEYKLYNELGRPSNLKKKFRVWFANIPRDKFRNRMRNPWQYIKLSKELENTDKTVLHDLIVHYTL
jgi:hypothetical protein